jgi:hypothetical protein
MSLPAYRPSLGAMREADLRRTRDAERLVGIKAEVRLKMNRDRRLRAVTSRLQPLFSQLEASLHAEKSAAVRRGERSRADAIERSIDVLHAQFCELARNIVEDLK